jgi:tetratricopeptide (TPR) repeat protein
MNEVNWLPSLLVLGLGLAIGLGASFAVRRGRRQRSERDSRELQLTDLEARRDELYRRLRSPDLNAGDRESLELAAAHTLRELDRLAPQRARRERAAVAAEEPAATPARAPEKAAPARRGARHPALVGFVAGMAVVLLVGTLVYLAVRDSGAARPPATPAPAGTAAEPHPDSEALPAETRRELERLEAAAAAAPNDLLARKRLALGRLDAGLYFEAFRDAEQILAGQPEDPDGLFIQGVVRLSMGSGAEALDLLDRVLVRFPEHMQAMVYRGLALAQSGEMEQAISTWEVALEMAGGSNPDIEALLQQARSQPPPAATAPPAAAPPAAATGAATAPAPSSPPPARPDPPAAANAAPDEAAYRITIELAPGTSVPPSATLFVFLRPGEAGPPTAVKRIPGPRFPLELTLGPGDAMMAGAALPDRGTLVARLSAGGSAIRGPDDLEASAAATIGQPVRLVVGGPG